MEDAIITKIEGHGRLKTDWRKNEVTLEITESERLFEGIVVGRPAAEAPWVTARICGVCPTAHNICAFKAVEGALGVKPDETAALLRRLHLDAQIIQSHALHLYFLALPDYLGIDSGLELKDSQPRYFNAALTLKEVSDEIASVVGGRATHPTTTTIGGYLKHPTAEELKELEKKLIKALKAAEETFNLAAKLKYPSLESPLLFLSQINEEGTYNIYESPKVKPSNAVSWPAENYRKEIGEELFRQAEVELLPDTNDDLLQNNPPLYDKLKQVYGRYIDHLPDSNMHKMEIDFADCNTVGQAVDRVSYIFDSPVDQKQSFLEQQDVAKRVEMVTDLLQLKLDILQRSKSVKQNDWDVRMN